MVNNNDTMSCAMCGSKENINLVVGEVALCHSCEHKFYNELKYVKNPDDLSGINDLTNGVRMILDGLSKLYGVNPNDCNFKDTPYRVGRLLMEKNWGTNPKACTDLLKVSFDSGNKYSGLITCNNIKVFSMCPHHLEDISYKISIGYVPNNSKCLGLSKLPRLCKVLAKSMLLQEDYTNKLLDILEETTECIGCGVYVVGEHGCIACRGVNMPDVPTVTSAVRGIMLANSSLKQEWLQIISNN